MTRVLDLSTGKHIVYSCGPREAVIAAHAQSLGDFSTWQYETKYGPMVEESSIAYYCGNYGAYKQPEPQSEMNK